MGENRYDLHIELECISTQGSHLPTQGYLPKLLSEPLQPTRRCQVLELRQNKCVSDIAISGIILQNEQMGLSCHDWPSVKIIGLVLN